MNEYGHTAQAISMTNQELIEQYGIQRVWLRECPYCESSHPVTVFPNRTIEYGDVYLAECRLAGLMVVDMEGC